MKDRKQNKRKIHPTYSILEKEFEGLNSYAGEDAKHGIFSTLACDRELLEICNVKVYTGNLEGYENKNDFIPVVAGYSFANMFKIGDKKKVRILEVNEEKKQIKLSMILNKNVKTEKRKRTKLSGTNLGFDLFGEILPEWISSKLEEISCEENNKLNK